MPATVTQLPVISAQAPARSAREILEAAGVDPDVILARRGRLRAAPPS